MHKFQKGAAFLVEDANHTDSFIPEHLTFEQRELVKTVHDFVANEVLPQEEFIDASQPGLVAKLLRESAKLGILAAEMPAEYGGLGLGKVDAIAIAEGSTLQGSFNVSYMCHTGIATLPLVYYGTKVQKDKYLAKLANGEMMAAFALTEPDAGSDAMAIKTRAVLSPDKKSYILNGQKQFITNGGFADLITVFAQFEDKGVTAFLVEKKFRGVTVGKEEEKMGIHGSSTVSLAFDNVPIPVENMLGAPGKGHHIAFNILNVGRLKLGGACSGSSKHLINLTYNYTKERIQFGKPLITFQMLQQKLAMMVARMFLLESLAFRVADNFDKCMAQVHAGSSAENALREYTVESAIAKVFGSEALFYVADDAIQLYGGYGYSTEYGIERIFRDCRINRIFEGTNEINRLVIIGTVLKMAAKGQLDIFKVLSTIQNDIKTLITAADKTDYASVIYSYVEVLKRLTLSVGAASIQKYANGIDEEEYVLSELADMLIDLYAVESAYVRARLLAEEGNIAKAKAMHTTTMFYLLNYAGSTIDRGRKVLARVMGSDAKEVEGYQKAMYGIMSLLRQDQQSLCMSIIGEVDNAGGYPF